MLVWEVLSYGELPYAEVANIDVQKRVKGGLRLACPPGAYEELFEVAQSCWKLPKKVRRVHCLLFASIVSSLSGLFFLSS